VMGTVARQGSDSNSSIGAHGTATEAMLKENAGGWVLRRPRWASLFAEAQRRTPISVLWSANRRRPNVDVHYYFCLASFHSSCRPHGSRSREITKSVVLDDVHRRAIWSPDVSYSWAADNA